MTVRRPSESQAVYFKPWLKKYDKQILWKKKINFKSGLFHDIYNYHICNYIFV